MVKTIIFFRPEILVTLQGETVWLNRHQMALSFDRDAKTIGKHINSICNEGELDQIQLSKKLRKFKKRVHEQ